MAGIKFDDLSSQEELDAAVKSAIDSEVSGLKDKNSELLGKLDDLKTKFAPFKDLDPDELRDALEERRKLREEKDAAEGNWEKLRDQMREDHKKELAKRDAKIEELAKRDDKNLQRSAIDAALEKANIAKPFRSAVAAMLREQIVLDGDGDKRAALIGDKSPAEYLEAFVASDEGKHYVAADFNSGGGSPGSGTGSGKTPGNPFDAKNPNITEQMRIQKENPEKAARLRKEAGGGKAAA